MTWHLQLSRIEARASRRVRVNGVVVALVAGLLAAGLPARAQNTWYVDDDAQWDPGPGDPSVSDPDEDGSADHPFDAIQEGIDASMDGDTVLVLDGTYTGIGNKDLDFAGRLIIVQSESTPENCVIDCEGMGGGFDFHTGETSDAVVDGLTITNGSSYPGGAVHCENSSPTIINCIFDRNQSPGEGGAVYCLDSYPTIVNCTFARNTARNYGGGVCCEGGAPTISGCAFKENTARGFGGGGVGCLRSSPVIRACTFRGNTAGSNRGGGAIYCTGKAAVISDCKMSINEAEGSGGAISCRFDNLTITNCVIVRNTTDQYGGGIICYESNATISHCSIVGNTARAIGLGRQGGGGICSMFGSPTITNCLIANNTTEDLSGGGIHSWGNTGLRVANCTIASNWAPDGRALACDSHDGLDPSTVEITNGILWEDRETIWNNDASAITIKYSDVRGGWPGAGNINAQPRFVDPDHRDYRVSPGSPVIDAGCNWAVLPDAADLDGDGDRDEITPLDLDGEGRFFDDPDTPDDGCGHAPVVDMGAYEFGDTDRPPCFGDLDGDRDVDLSDLAELLGRYDEPEPGAADLTCDGDVDLDDVAALLAVYRQTCE